MGSYYTSLEHYNDIEPSNPYKLPSYTDLYNFVRQVNPFDETSFVKNYIFNPNEPDSQLFLTPFLKLITHKVSDKVKHSIRKLGINHTHKIILFIDKGMVGIKELEREKRRCRRRQTGNNAKNMDYVHGILKFVHDKIPISTLMKYISSTFIKQLCTHLQVSEISLAEFGNNEADVDMVRFANCVQFNRTDNGRYLLANQMEEVERKTILTYNLHKDETHIESWKSYIEKKTLPIDNVVFVGHDIDIPFFFLISQFHNKMNTNHNLLLNFYVLQFLSGNKPAFDPVSQTHCRMLLYNLNQLSTHVLNGIASMSIMLLVGSDYAEGCFTNPQSTHFISFIKDMTRLTDKTCLCLNSIRNNVGDKVNCSECGLKVKGMIVAKTLAILRIMSRRSMGSMPKFNMQRWLQGGDDDDDQQQLWAVPFVGVALITACIVWTGIHKYLRVRDGFLVNKKIDIKYEYLYMWLELLYYILSYINCSSNYLSIIHEIPQAHRHRITTKILLYHTAILVNGI